MNETTIREYKLADRHAGDLMATPSPLGPSLNEDDRKRLLSEAASLRAQARRQYKVQCLECGTELVGLSRKKFCGQAHQRRNWRRRLAAMNPGDTLPPPESAV